MCLAKCSRHLCFTLWVTSVVFLEPRPGWSGCGPRTMLPMLPWQCVPCVVVMRSRWIGKAKHTTLLQRLVEWSPTTSKMLYLDAEGKWWSRFTTICFDFWKSRPPPSLGWLWLLNWQDGSLWLEAIGRGTAKPTHTWQYRVISNKKGGIKWEGICLFLFLLSLEKSAFLFNNLSQSMRAIFALTIVNNIWQSGS